MLPFEAAAAELKTKLQVNLNPCHTNEWDNYNYKNLTFRLKQNKNITILNLSLKSWTFDFLTVR